MAEEKIIYHKTYPREYLTNFKANTKIRKQTSDASKVSFEELLTKIYKDTYYVLLPNKQRHAEQFVKEAIRVSKWHEIDITIVKRDFYITAKFFMSQGEEIHQHKRLMMLADNITLSNNIYGYDIVMQLDYYTHAMFKRGRQIFPY